MKFHEPKNCNWCNGSGEVGARGKYLDCVCECHIGQYVRPFIVWGCLAFLISFLSLFLFNY